MRTVDEIIRELVLIRTDNTMSDLLWQQSFPQLTRELDAARKVADFNYDAAIEETRQDALADYAERQADAPEYDRQWVPISHILRGIVYVWPMMVMFASAAVAAL